MNTLHWHATDAESFPIQSSVYPQLAQKGAYAPGAGKVVVMDIKQTTAYSYYVF